MSVYHKVIAHKTNSPFPALANIAAITTAHPVCDIIRINGNGSSNIGDKLIMEKRKPLAVKKIQLQGQLRFQFNLKFTAPKPAHLTCLNNWLTESLGIDSTSLNSPHCSSLSQQESLAEQWLWRILLLARQLMQDARVPIFDFPLILDLMQNEQASNQWHAKVALARIDMIPHPAYVFALNQSARLCEWAGENPINGPNLKLFYDEIEKQIIGALSKSLPPYYMRSSVYQFLL